MKDTDEYELILIVIEVFSLNPSTRSITWVIILRAMRTIGLLSVSRVITHVTAYSKLLNLHMTLNAYLRVFHFLID